MSKQEIPENPSYKYTNYTNLLGIDLTCDATQTPRNRAADLLNVYPDPGTSNPRKRPGWRKLYTFPTGTKFLGSRHIVEWNLDIIVTNKAVYWHDSSQSTWTVSNVHTLISNTSNIDAGVGFIGFDPDGNYWLIAYKQRHKLSYDGSTLNDLNGTAAYVPTTVISRNPNGTGGYDYESVNVFTKERIIQFLGDGTSTNYYLYPNEDRSNHFVVAISSVEVRNASGQWTALSYGPDYTPHTSGTITAYNASKTTTYSYSLIDYVTMPAQTPIVNGQDNVRMTVVEFTGDYETVGSSTVYYGYYDPITDAVMTNAVCARYGMKSMDREFYAADNGRVYYTDPDNYNYIPDDNYFTLEVDTPIVGFHRKNTFLVAVTQDSAEFTIYMIHGSTMTITHHVLNEQGVSESNTEDITYFIAQTAMAGTGAISHNSFATLIDDTLFLSRRGVMAITSNTVTSETVLANRSELINPRLIEEADLSKAAAGIWQGMYLLSLNGHVYVLDSRNTHRNLDVSYGYECYYWDNVNASNFLSYGGNLFFGNNATGNWCRFNTDIHNVTAYEDNGTLDQNGNLYDGDAIHALYALRLDSDNAPQYLKTLNKRGTVMELMQLSNSECKLSYSKDGNEPIVINQVALDNRFTWSLIDFENFSFNSIAIVRTFYTKKKVKKYKYLQFIFESDEADVNFGIIGLTKTYYFGNFAKR